MSATYVADSDFTLYVGDVRDVLRGMPDESVHCVVTSPPYWGLRDYGMGAWDGGDAECDHKNTNWDRQLLNDGANRDRTTPMRDVCGKCGARRVDKQLGLEPTPEEYVANMVEVFREVRRVLRRDGTCWLNLGDSYASSQANGGQFDFSTSGLKRDGRPEEGRIRTLTQNAKELNRTQPAQRLVHNLKPKDLVGIPWRLAFALQADGWYLRADIIWAKPNPMPESVTDRPTKAHEYVFLLSRSPRYFFDQEAVREPPSGEIRPLGDKPTVPAYDGQRQVEGSRWSQANGATGFGSAVNGRNVRSVWEIATQPYAEAHFATFPEALVERCLLAGTSERGCCPVCRAPWEREVERERVTTDKNPRGRTAKDGLGNGELASTAHFGEVATLTTGWRPTCSCGDGGEVDGWQAFAPVPCTVLDPFMGSGTTALVARRLGRKSIGIELNEEYAALAATRLQQLSLLV